MSDIKISLTDKSDNTLRALAFRGAYALGDWMVYSREGALLSYGGRHAPTAEVVAAAEVAIREYVAGTETRAEAAKVAEAAKLTLRVRNVGRGRDFGRANEYARANEGQFDGEAKTWTIRISEADRADLRRLHDLAEVEVISEGQIIVSEQPAPTYTAEQIVAEVEAAPVVVNAEVQPVGTESVQISYGVNIKGETPSTWRGELVTVELAADGTVTEVDRQPCGYGEMMYAVLSHEAVTAQPSEAQRVAVANWAMGTGKPAGMHGTSWPLKVWAGLSDISEAIRLSQTAAPIYRNL